MTSTYRTRCCQPPLWTWSWRWSAKGSSTTTPIARIPLSGSCRRYLFFEVWPVHRFGRNDTREALKLLSAGVLGILIAAPLVRGEAASPMKHARVKDVATVEGIRDNQLVGYGIVVGLH